MVATSSGEDHRYLFYCLRHFCNYFLCGIKIRHCCKDNTREHYHHSDNRTFRNNNVHTINNNHNNTTIDNYANNYNINKTKTNNVESATRYALEEYSLTRKK